MHPTDSWEDRGGFEGPKFPQKDYEAPPPNRIPTSLKIVAYLFVLNGVMAIVEVLFSLANSRLSINFGVLGVFIGPGLLRFSQGWRTCALVWLWIGLIASPLILLMVISRNEPIDFLFFGKKSGTISKELVIPFALAIFIFTIWEYRVLTRPDVRKLFGLRASNKTVLEKRLVMR
jgi:hypothetical protein